MKRAFRCAALCGEVASIDPIGSPLSAETDALTSILDFIRTRVDSGGMRLSVCMRIMDTVFDLQEENVAERKAQLERHGIN
jgi:hypothetical protein